MHCIAVFIYLLKRSATTALFVFLNLYASPQNIEWQVLSPETNAIVGNENLFVSAIVNNFEPSPDAIILLDDVPLDGSVKVSGNRISFVHVGMLRDGLHHLTIKTPAKNSHKPESYSWTFYVNKKTTQLPGQTIVPVKEHGGLNISGNLVADNRNTWLSGNGQALRQEPDYTRTVSLVMQAKYKNVEIPVRIFATTDNRFISQSSNFFQVGFHNKWLELDIGDINPNFDRLILTGVRVTGAKMKIKVGKSSFQAIYGDMVRQPLEGLLERYTPGIGFLPTTFVNDTQYILPGTYKRWILAGRAEIVSRKETLKFGFTGLKVKDKINSIQYGFQPKDNLVGGMDVTLKLFRKKLGLHSSIAVSGLTNDITYGTIRKDQFLPTFSINIPIDAEKYKDFLVINASTLPLTYANVKDAIALFSQVTYTNKFQALTIEYRNVGPLFYSLGNPFLRNNYAGITISDRFHFIQRKLNFNVSYQQYVNNLNQSLPQKVNTDVLNASMIITPNDKWPTVLVNYMSQNRNSEQEVKAAYALKDRLQNLLLNINYRKSFWSMDHNFRFSISYNNRKDLLQSSSETQFYNYMIGVSETISKLVTVNAEYGKTLVRNTTRENITNINTYSLFTDWQVKRDKLTASAGLTNNRVALTAFSPETYRLSVIGRLAYKFYKSMSIDVEGGYSPYKEKVIDVNNFDEKYVYVRYLYDFDFKL
jgi:hypothetical protein